MATIAEQWMNQGMDKGHEKGLEKGRLIGTIQTCSEILREPVDETALRSRPPGELRQLAGELQRRVQDQLSGQWLIWIELCVIV